MSDTERDEGQASTRVAELKNKIQQATELIGELRETNYSLNGEVAELRREIESLSESGARPSSSDSTDEDEQGHGSDRKLQAELDALRQERKTIRDKVALLLERMEKLES